LLAPWPSAEFCRRESPEVKTLELAGRGSIAAMEPVAECFARAQTLARSCLRPVPLRCRSPEKPCRRRICTRLRIQTSQTRKQATMCAKAAWIDVTEPSCRWSMDSRTPGTPLGYTACDAKTLSTLRIQKKIRLAIQPAPVRPRPSLVAPEAAISPSLPSRAN